MNCQQCYKLYKDDSVEPLCKTSKCPIGEELAADPVVNEIAMGFLMAKRIHAVNQVDEMYIRTLRDLEIWEDTDLLLELETLYHEKQSAKQRNSILNRGGDTGVGGGIGGSYY